VTGDVFDCLAALPDGSVDLILTSPPFLALRSYLPADHPDKGKEIGSEPDPASFVDTLLALSAEWRRVLAPHGSLCVELGDTYSGSGGAGGDYGEEGLRAGQAKYTAKAGRLGRTGHERGEGGFSGRSSHGSGGGPGYPLAKSACLIPELYRVALAYGRNPLTGAVSPAGSWRVRNTVRWCRPNPPVGALGDKFRPATSDMVVACVSPRRWFDLDAVRTEHKADPANYSGNGYTKGRPEGVGGTVGMAGNPAGAPPLDWWEVSTEPYSGSHYATWPRKLLARPIKSMCPLRVCTVCGEPSRRIVEKSPEYAAFRARKSDRGRDDHTVARKAYHWAEKGGVGSLDHHDDGGARGQLYVTVGWTDCGHDAWRPGVVLDPFAGSGTTLAVAAGFGRTSLGFDLDERNADLALHRVGALELTCMTLDEFKAGLPA
jgi:hypothetical protein